jgi:hypothetical protein
MIKSINLAFGSEFGFLGKSASFSKLKTVIGQLNRTTAEREKANGNQ